MANKFTKSVLERQYLEKQRSGPQRGRDSRTEDSEKDEPGAVASSRSGSASNEAPLTGKPRVGAVSQSKALDSTTSNPQGDITIEGTPAGAAQGSMPEHIIPNPQGRDGNELAAGIDEAFTRADGGQEGLQNAREKGEGLDSTTAPDSTEAGSEVSAFTRNVTTTTETEPQNNQINAGPGGDFSPQRGAGQSPKMVRSEPPKGSAETSEPTAATSVANTGGMGNAMPDLVSSYLIRTPERIAKNKTFYLDEAVINAIRTAAKKQKVTESKLVNDILGGVLGIR